MILNHASRGTTSPQRRGASVLAQVGQDTSQLTLPSWVELSNASDAKPLVHACANFVNISSCVWLPMRYIKPGKKPETQSTRWGVYSHLLHTHKRMKSMSAASLVSVGRVVSTLRDHACACAHLSFELYVVAVGQASKLLSTCFMVTRAEYGKRARTSVGSNAPAQPRTAAAERNAATLQRYNTRQSDSAVRKLPQPQPPNSCTRPQHRTILTTNGQ